MSYCRFSSDNFNCDAYAWDDVSGCCRCEVAVKRWRLWWRALHWLTDKRFRVGTYSMRSQRPYMDWLMCYLPTWATHARIKHPLAGTSHAFETETELYAFFQTLYAEGFNIPKDLLTYQELDSITKELS